MISSGTALTLNLVLCPELVGAKKGFNRIEPNNNDYFISPLQLAYDPYNREESGSNTLHREGIWILIHNIWVSDPFN